MIYQKSTAFSLKLNQTKLNLQYTQAYTNNKTKPYPYNRQQQTRFNKNKLNVIFCSTQGL